MVLALLVSRAGKLAIVQVRVDGRDVSALLVGGASWLAGTRSSSMQAGPHLFVVRVVPLDPLTLGAAEALFLTPCCLAEC
jgi:hypothetical protein